MSAAERNRPTWRRRFARSTSLRPSAHAPLAQGLTLFLLAISHSIKYTHYQSLLGTSLCQPFGSGHVVYAFTLCESAAGFEFELGLDFLGAGYFVSSMLIYLSYIKNCRTSWLVETSYSLLLTENAIQSTYFCT